MLPKRSQDKIQNVKPKKSKKVKATRRMKRRRKGVYTSVKAVRSNRGHALQAQRGICIVCFPKKETRLGHLHEI